MRNRTSSGQVGVLAIATALVMLPVAGPAARDLGRPQANQHEIVVTVLDKSDAPVTTLTAADFTIREDDRTREVLDVAPAPLPTHVVLLVDDSQATNSLTVDLREGLKTFVNGITGVGATPFMRLATFGDRYTTRVEFTNSAGRIMLAVDQIFPRTGAGATLLEAIRESAQALQAQQAERGVIVAFVAETGPEFSQDRHEQIASALRESGAALWSVVLQDRLGQNDSDAGRERSMVLGDVAAESGGYTRTILSREGITPAFTAIATALSSSYVIRYGRPDSLIPPDHLEVTVQDPDLRVVTSAWASR